MTDITRPAQRRPALCAVVMGYRNEATIAGSVRSLLEQDAREPFEVVVVTSGGDTSAAIIRSAFPEVRVVESPDRLLPGAARNAGLALTDAHVVAFLAADCTALPGWVDSRIEAHRSGHRAVASAIAAPDNANLADRAGLYLLFPGRLSGHAEGPADASQCYSLSFDRALLDEAGPFDANLRTGEDTLMVRRLSKLGVTAWFDPRIRTVHPGPPTVVMLLRDQFRRGGLRAGLDSLSVPAGRHRQRIERLRSPVALMAGCVALAARSFGGRLRWTAKAAWRGARHERLSLMQCTPAMALGLMANQMGWGMAIYRSLVDTRSTPRREPTCEPPTASSGTLQRWVASTGERVIALTFDDGPSDDTPAVLDELRRLDVSATFFMLGDQVVFHPGVAARAVAEGHAVGTHGCRHVPFTELDPRTLALECCSAAALLAGEVDRPVVLVRPPGGHYDAIVVDTLAEAGLTTWLWTIDPRDWELREPTAIAEAVLANLTPGAVVLLHDGPADRAATVAALPAIVEGARARGYRFVTLPEPTMAAMGTEDSAITGTQEG